MNFPNAFDVLRAIGYDYSGEGHCRKCGTRILWYRTPDGKTMPMNPDGTGHWPSCPKAKYFRRRKLK